MGHPGDRDFPVWACPGVPGVGKRVKRVGKRVKRVKRVGKRCR